jgi:iron-sulfur cluster assembly accessory protein
VEYKWQEVSSNSTKKEISSESIDLNNGYKMYVCDKSAIFIWGMTVHWIDDMYESRFSYENPNAQTSCGCDKSFSSV